MSSPTSMENVSQRLGKAKVLHDFDNPYPSGRWALKRGLTLVLYAFSKKVGFLRRFCDGVYKEAFENMWTLYCLDGLLGIRTIFGINDRVAEVFPALKPEALRSSEIRAVRHWHVSKDDVHWEPELGVPPSQWWFDQEYAKGARRPEPNEWVVFHCDYPHLLPYYIRYLYELSFGKSPPQ